MISILVNKKIVMTLFMTQLISTNFVLLLWQMPWVNTLEVPYHIVAFAFAFLLFPLYKDAHDDQWIHPEKKTGLIVMTLVLFCCNILAALVLGWHWLWLFVAIQLGHTIWYSGYAK